MICPASNELAGYRYSILYYIMICPASNELAGYRYSILHYIMICPAPNPLMNWRDIDITLYYDMSCS